MGIKAGGWLQCHLSLMCVLLPGPEWGRRWGAGKGTLLLGPLALCRDSSASLQLPPTHCSLSLWSSPSAPTVGLETLGPDCDPKGLLPPAPVGTGRAETWKGRPSFHFLGIGRAQEGLCPEPGQDYTAGSLAVSLRAARELPLLSRSYLEIHLSKRNIERGTPVNFGGSHSKPTEAIPVREFRGTVLPQAVYSSSLEGLSSGKGDQT